MRLHNTSQLSGFAKADDLAYFLMKIGGIEYVHQPLLAPTDPMLKAYKKEKGDWGTYESLSRPYGGTRGSEALKPEMFDNACLLCSGGQAALLPPALGLRVPEGRMERRAGRTSPVNSKLWEISGHGTILMPPGRGPPWTRPRRIALHHQCLYLPPEEWLADLV
ncbi:MAG: hypothetical protein R3D28_18285 [Geminicoccaceae bacterium]